MACAGCTTSNGEKPNGCKSNGGCGTGGCNRMNTYDWLNNKEIHDVDEFDMVEVSFKNGARKAFFHNPSHTRTVTGDIVVVESSSGYDIGRITLSGELVRLQMKKKKAREDGIYANVIRRANNRDLERLKEARDLERPTMTRAKAIARTLGLEMKIGDVEYQGDKRKATFFYTADGRVDFRELIRHYAKEFRVKIEMRQIGARQESARIGGIGSCGRELCCSTWLSDFKSVTTSAARYQNLAINQSKLSGQCGRLKCCLNYELDTYMDALEHFPKRADKLQTLAGEATLIKTDIFKRIMYYVINEKEGRSKVHALDVKQVEEIIELNAKGEKPATLVSLHIGINVEPEMDFESVNEVIDELPREKRKKKKRRKPRNKKRKNKNRNQNQNQNQHRNNSNKNNSNSNKNNKDKN